MILIIGPSGCGKSTLLDRLCQRGFIKVKSCTTRTPRNTKEYDDYNFLIEKDFKNLIISDALAEYAEYAGNYYGTSIKDIFIDNAIKIVEPKGFDILTKKYNNIISIYVDSSEDTRRHRMLSRGDSTTDVDTRLAVDKVLFNDEVKYKCNIIFNNDVEITESRINEIIKAIATEQYGK